MTIPEGVVFNEQGLIPVVAQDEETGRVLMLAFMNREALEATLTTGRAVYYSRSRGELWRKGDTSGHAQFVRRVELDCDGDSLLLTVHQIGPACHTGTGSCFDAHTLAAVTDLRPDDSASTTV
nr:MAG: phosphoribosyl-AMP cyclohydrolase [actinobacterium acMicro-1]